MPVELPANPIRVPLGGPEVPADPVRQPAGPAVRPLHPQIALPLTVPGILKIVPQHRVALLRIPALGLQEVSLKVCGRQQYGQTHRKHYPEDPGGRPPEPGGRPPGHGEALPLRRRPAALYLVAEHPRRQKELQGQQEEEQSLGRQRRVGQKQLPYPGPILEKLRAVPHDPVNHDAQHARQLAAEGLFPHVLPLHTRVGLDGGGVHALPGPEVEQAAVLADQLPPGLVTQGQVVRPAVLVLFRPALPAGGLHPAGAGVLRAAEGGGEQAYLLQLPTLLRPLIQLRLGRLGVLDGVAEPAGAFGFLSHGRSLLTSASQPACPTAIPPAGPGGPPRSGDPAAARSGRSPPPPPPRRSGGSGRCGPPPGRATPRRPLRAPPRR